MSQTPEMSAADSSAAGRGLPWARFAIVIALVALDLWSKQWIFEWWERSDDLIVRGPKGLRRIPILGEWLAVMRVENPGMAFGQFGDWPRVLVFGRIAAVFFLIVALWRTKASQRLVLFGLVLVLAGALGNLWDNLFREPEGGRPFGMVRDFIDVYFAVFEKHFPTFNVADSCITVGAVLFIVHGLFAKDEPEAAPASGPTGPSTPTAESPTP